MDAVQAHLHEDERVFGLLDDIHIITTPPRVGEVYGVWLAPGSDSFATQLKEPLVKWIPLPEYGGPRSSELPNRASKSCSSFWGPCSGWSPDSVDACSVSPRCAIRFTSVPLRIGQQRPTTADCNCLCQWLEVPPDVRDAGAGATETLPLMLGGLGLRSDVRTLMLAFCASWAHTLFIVEERHPTIAAEIMHVEDDMQDLHH